MTEPLKTHGNYVVAVCLKHDYPSRPNEGLPCPLCERAAREQAEEALREIEMECGNPDPSDGEGTSPQDVVASVGGLKQRAEQAEARLAEAITLLQELVRPLCVDDSATSLGHLMICSIQSGDPTDCPVCGLSIRAYKFLSSTTPPPILAELAELKSKLADERTTSDYLAAAIQMTYPHATAIARYNEGLDKSKSTPAAAIVFRKLESAESELAALKAELEVHRAGKCDDSWARQCEENWALEKERGALKLKLEVAYRTAGFFASVIKCKEPWTTTCEEALSQLNDDTNKAPLMTHSEKIRFLDNLDAAIKFHQTLREPNHAIAASLTEIRKAFAKAVHMEDYMKDINPPAV